MAEGLRILQCLQGKVSKEYLFYHFTVNTILSSFIAWPFQLRSHLGEITT
ncbi:MAG: hypothetical protein L0226_07510 [Acidobacteria bacterium]|nr:hypothetical protein [Acidobacteriota bacterium]